MDRAGPLRTILFLFLPFETYLLFLPLDAGAQDVGTARGGEWYVAGFFTRSSPVGASIRLNADKIPEAHFDASTGGGAKLGIFMKPFNFAFGGEVEIVSHATHVSAPTTVEGGRTRFTNQDVNFFNIMLNLLARYPGDFIQPYIGLGLGLSHISLDGRTKSATASKEGDDTTAGLAFQGIVGTRLNVTKHVFVFSEFKYFFTSTGAGCRDGEYCNSHTIDYQAQYVSAGMGVKF